MKNRMIAIIAIFCSTVFAYAQADQLKVGDEIMVKPTTKAYLTGEKPSKWVYNVPHIISQIGTRKYPDGVLLNINGANSWLAKSDVTKLAKMPIQPQVIRDTVYVSVEKEPLIIHDTIIQGKADTEVAVYNDTIIVVEPSLHRSRFQLNGNVLGIGGINNAGAGAELIFGSRLNEYVFVGGGFSLEQIWLGLDGVSMHGTQFPIFVNMKAYLPVEHKYYPHFEMSVGANLGKLDYGQSDLGRKSGLYYGLHARAGVGFDYKSLSVGLGYQYGSGCSSINKDWNHIYVKIGFVFISD